MALRCADLVALRLLFSRRSTIVSTIHPINRMGKDATPITDNRKIPSSIVNRHGNVSGLAKKVILNFDVQLSTIAVCNKDVSVDNLPVDV